MPDLILALDVTEKKKALAIAHACAPNLDMIKIGYPLVLSAGLSIAGELEKDRPAAYRRLQGRRYPQHKPAHLRPGVCSGFSGIICHGFPGIDSVKACIASARAPGSVLCGRRDEPSGRE